VEVPVLEIRPPADFAPLDAALHKIDTYDWLILTSANAVRAVDERATQLGVALEQSAGLKVAAVGEATAAAARKAGLRVRFVPEEYVAESLVAGLMEGIHLQTLGVRVLLARAAVARDVIPDALREAGDAAEGGCGADRRGDFYQFVERDASGGGGAAGWGCVAAGWSSGGFDWADYHGNTD
jgi:uroporphyrinogen-III synthase